MVSLVNFATALIAYLLVGVTLYMESSVWTFSIPTQVRIVDSNYQEDKPNYLCWISPDTGSLPLKELAKNAPSGCNSLSPGLVTETFVGHQFLMVRNNHTTENPPKIISIQAAVKEYDIATYKNYETTKDFDYIVEWQRLLVNRRTIGFTFAVILLFYFLAVEIEQYLLPGNTQNSNSTEKPIILIRQGSTVKVKNDVDDKQIVESMLRQVRKPFIPRHIIKFYAIVTMVINHCGYTFLADNVSLRSWFTVFADAGGSSHWFGWLIGYNVTSTKKNKDVYLLASFLFLDRFVVLPPPITYDTLVNLTLIRIGLQYSLFHVNPRTGRCTAAEAHIFIHSALCCALIILNKIFGNEGLKLVNILVVLYAINGRLFALKSVESATRVLWLGVAFAMTLQSGMHTWNTIHLNSGIYQHIYGLEFVSLTLINMIAFNWPATDDSKISAISVPWIVRVIAQYSLEIYVGHFLLLKAIYTGLKTGNI